ncbi:DUF6527 family protein [Bdellovibrio reynosensis]|uniref:DUF6527 family protein n=1 Tax=Bdellovibrio reynosensis TaxID=2835041 RepID=UPI0038B38AA0
MIYATASHLCCCGCGSEVVTPLTPTDWRLTFDGTTVSLDPSIGNWSFPCQSHYWITRSRTRWSNHWSKERVNFSRAIDSKRKQDFYEKESLTSSTPSKSKAKENWLYRILQCLR